MDYFEKYKLMREGIKNIPDEVFQALVKKCQDNLWLMEGGIPFEDDPYFELDSPYTFKEIASIGILEVFFEHGNWSIRQGIVYKDLVFINQVNGGDEWWTLKKDGDKYYAFDSITFKPMIKRREFRRYIRRLENATVGQCMALEY